MNSGELAYSSFGCSFEGVMKDSTLVQYSSLASHIQLKFWTISADLSKIQALGGSVGTTKILLAKQ